MKNLKKVIALVAVFAMIVSTVAFAQTFSDVAESDNYYEAIETLSKLGIITGDDNDGDGVFEFRPNDSITRAEIAVIVSRIQGQIGTVAQTNTVFTDVPATHWASGYIASAANRGIVNGYGDGNFGPDDKVLYQDVVKMLMETLGYKPFAQNNGGYPTGYMLAAQKYGVLDGVIGGAEGVEATRGQVAQLTYNAIDTELMERYTYGNSNEQYIIYDGVQWTPRKTLMNQNLGIQKLRGVVTANAYADDIDTDAKDKITLYIEDNYLGTNDTSDDYEKDTSKDLYVGDTDANEYLGYDVVVYVKDDKNETPTIISITEATGKNQKVTFTLDKFDDFDGLSIYYMKNDTDRSATSLKLDKNVDTLVFYNGKVYEKDLWTLLGEGALIEKDTTLSGAITVLDNNDTTGYDVVFVEVATAGVVDTVSNRGVVTFKNSVGSKATMNSIAKVDFGSSDTDKYLVLTKDGKTIDYSELKEWDVLSIIANTAGNGEYIKMNVLSDTAIQGSVSRTSSSDTSEDGKAYTIDGVDYDLAEGFDQNGTIKAGATGTFYADAYGKLVYYNKSQGGASTTADNYAYVIKITQDSSGFDENIPELQLLYKDGKVGTYDFKSTVTIENPSAVICNIVDEDVDSDSVTFKYADYTSAQVQAVLDEIVGTVVTINAKDGIISSLTMAAPKNSSDSTLKIEGVDEGHADYDSDKEQLKVNGKNYEVKDDALVFFIGKSGGNFAYNTQATGSADDCSTGVGADLNTKSNLSAAVYSNGEDGNADVIVLYNTDAGISAETGIAYVTAIGSATVDGTKVLSVDYYQDGEFKTAYTDDTTVDGLKATTVTGSAFKFGFTGDKITSAQTCIEFDGTVRDKIPYYGNPEKVGIPNVSSVKVGTYGDEDFYFGAVVKKSGSKITVAKFAKEGGVLALKDWEIVNLGSKTVNYYLYDPTRSGKSKFQLGSFGDINCDKQYSNEGMEGDSKYDIYMFDGADAYDAPAYGLLDFVFIRINDAKADVIDYMAYEYDDAFALKK